MSEEILNQQSSEKVDSGGLLDILSKLMPKEPTASQPHEKPLGDGNILSSLLSNPEIIGKLPDLISVIAPLMGSLPNIGNLPNAGALTQAVSKPIAEPRQAHLNHETQNRAALLCALKPYLKKERQEAIDYMIKLSRLGDILKTL